MKWIKYLFLSLLIVAIVFLVAGYFMVTRKMTPPPNYLHVSDNSDGIPITWWQDESSEIAALLLPIRVPGVKKTLYMQFDLGSPSTLFYRRTLNDLKSHLPSLNFELDSTNYLFNFSFEMEKITVNATKFRMIDYGSLINWKDSTSLNIIGTIGSDLIEKKVTLLDFISDTCYFGTLRTDTDIYESLDDFSFNYRWVFLPAVIDGKKRKLWYDTGTSGFELLTSKTQWKNMSKRGATPVSNDVNSWGNAIKTHTIAADGTIRFGKTNVKLNSVTYVEGHSFLQEVIARATGMGGMIGNKIFMNKQVLIDGKSRKFGVFDHDDGH
ncbi:MAG: hypothetical protein AAGA66_12300 [Bacteroidota bacterium]